MWKIIQIFLITFSINACSADECNCLNTVYVDTPKNLNQCDSSNIFMDQITKNYNTIFSKLEDEYDKYKCNFDAYQKDLRKMKKNTLEIVKAFDNCNEQNCSEDVTNAINAYNIFRTTFALRTRCAVGKLSADCARAVFLVRPLAFNSAENTITSMLSCVKLKAKQETKPLRTPVQLRIKPKSDYQCNCVQISNRPYAENERMCSSKSFRNKLRDFISRNYRLIDETYLDSVDSVENLCYYQKLKQFYASIQSATLRLIETYEGPNPTFNALNKTFQECLDIMLQYSSYLRDYILDNEKNCYLNPRRIRNNPFTTAEWVVGNLYKCLRYVDKSNNVCSSIKY